MHEFWSGPSDRLGLALLARAYDDGLKLRGDGLVALRQEIETLSADWVKTVSDDHTKTTGIGNRNFDMPLLVHLTK
jgi:hypothetical protein